VNNRTSTRLAVLVGAVCVFFFVRLFVSDRSRTVSSDVVQGVLIGAGLAFVTAQILARIKATKINGWMTIVGCGMPGNGMFMRAACAQIFPGPSTYRKRRCTGQRMRMVQATH